MQEVVEKLFGKAPRNDVNPDEAVAAGAAIQGDVLGGGRSDVLLLDVTPLTLGIETMGGIMAKLVTKNTTIPTKANQIFSTAEDNQSAVTIRVFQGERELAHHNKMLGEFNLEGIDPAPRGMPQIEVAFDIDANGILSVSAKDKNTGKENNITIKANSGITEDEIKKMIAEAEQYAEDDKKAREVIETRNGVESELYTIKKELTQYKDLATEEEWKTIEDAFDAAHKTAVDSSDLEEMKKGPFTVAEVAKPLFDKIKAKKAEEVAAQKDAAEGSPEGEVIDASFTETKAS